jgi:formylglycine-generating enzyme required for sulfatase activity
MVAVAGRFCVDRYEASVVDDVYERPLNPHYPPWAPLARETYDDWTERLLHNRAGSTVALPIIPPYQLQPSWMPRAVSRPGVAPQGHVSKLVARAACAGAGKRLCSEDEWRAACRGERDTRFPYGSDYRAKACNVDAAVHPAILLHGVVHDGVLKDPRLNAVGHAGRMLLQQTGGLPECRSAWGADGAYDLVGNLDEWVEAAEPVYRGGHYARATAEGCEYRNDRHKEAGLSYYNYSIGFRCCADLRPTD